MKLTVRRPLSRVKRGISKTHLIGAGLTVVVTVFIGLAAGDAGAHVPYIGTVKLSGQLDGRLTVDV